MPLDLVSNGNIVRGSCFVSCEANRSICSGPIWSWIWLNIKGFGTQLEWLILIPDLPLDCSSLADVPPGGRCFSICSSLIWLDQADKAGVSVFGLCMSLLWHCQVLSEWSRCGYVRWNTVKIERVLTTDNLCGVRLPLWTISPLSVACLVELPTPHWKHPIVLS